MKTSGSLYDIDSMGGTLKRVKMNNKTKLNIKKKLFHFGFILRSIFK